MLEVYMDDSGTHGGSPVVVWGGVVGYKHYLDKLEAAWRERLEKPCDGKPPIRAFHSYDLEHALGEFEGYNRAESDLTRRNFRQVIIESDVTVLAYGVSTRDWDEIVRPKQPKFTAEEAVFGKVIHDVTKVAKAHNDPMSLQFDKGRDTPELRALIAPTIKNAGYDDRFVSYGFSPVGGVCALQAADLVVHEAFRAFCAVNEDPSTVPRAHAKKLFEDTFFGQANWMGRKEIKDAVKLIERNVKRRAKRARKVL